MTRSRVLLLIITVVFSFLSFHPPILRASERRIPIQYQSPLPGAQYIRSQASIIIRTAQRIDQFSLDTPGLFQVEGSSTGSHPGTVILSDDGRTVIFKPNSRFAIDDTITVNLSAAIRTVQGDTVAPASFVFYTGGTRIPSSLIDQWSLEAGFQAGVPTIGSGIDTLPAGFPIIHATTHGPTAPGNLFLSNFRFGGPAIPFLMILDNSGDPVFSRRMNSPCLDFKAQPNGLLTYFNFASEAFYALNSSYQIVDSFKCGDGYPTDGHELRLLPDGHALLMSYDLQTVDMSQIVPGGYVDADVTGLVIQELDRSKNVVFQWRSWDHFLLTDATHENLLSTAIDYAHGNAIELDDDGHLLISSRHMDEITKIDRETGLIIWRWGGVNNDFTFVNDTLGFSHQHSIVSLGNRRYLLYDNGNYHPRSVSRAVEYVLDMTTMTATLVWEYRNSPEVYGAAMGNVQRLPNGNTLIGWGSTTPTVTEVRPDGEKVFELSFESGMFSYRAFRFPQLPLSVSPGSDIPGSFFLAQNYPNPFNGATTIGYTLVRPEEVSLRIYDMLGREVASPVSNVRHEAGQHRVVIDSSPLASGMYFYRLVAGSHSEMKKMVLLK